MAGPYPEEMQKMSGLDPAPPVTLDAALHEHGAALGAMRSKVGRLSRILQPLLTPESESPLSSIPVSGMPRSEHVERIEGHTRETMELGSWLDDIMRRLELQEPDVPMEAVSREG